MPSKGSKGGGNKRSRTGRSRIWTTADERRVASGVEIGGRNVRKWLALRELNGFARDRDFVTFLLNLASTGLLSSMARKRKLKSRSRSGAPEATSEVLFNSATCVTVSRETGDAVARPHDHPPIKLKIARLSFVSRPSPCSTTTATTPTSGPSGGGHLDDEHDVSGPPSLAAQEPPLPGLSHPGPSPPDLTRDGPEQPSSLDDGWTTVVPSAIAVQPTIGDGEEAEPCHPGCHHHHHHHPHHHYDAGCEVDDPGVLESCRTVEVLGETECVPEEAVGPPLPEPPETGESNGYGDVVELNGVVLSADDVDQVVCRDGNADDDAGSQHHQNLPPDQLESEDEKDSDWLPVDALDESRQTRRSTRVATLKSKQGQRPAVRSRARILTPQSVKRRKPTPSDIRKAPALTWTDPSPPPSLPPPLSPMSAEPLPRPLIGVDKVRPCGDCSQKHQPSDCQLHRPAMVVPDSPLSVCEEDQILPMSEISLPDILKLVTVDQKHGPSVVATGHILQHTQFGPLIGLPIDEADIHEDMDLKNIWEIFCDNNVKLYMDTSDEGSSNWLRYLRPAATKSERNLSAITKEGSLFFVTVKDVSAGMELVYWAEDPTVSWSKKKIEKTSCGGCNQKFHHPIYYRMHCMIFHDPNYSLTIRKYHCKICGIAVLGKENIMRHASEMHDGKGAYQCQYCKKFFLRLNYLDMHRTYGCKLNPRRSRPLCDLCGKKFCQPQKLKVHIRRMHSDISDVLKEFQCKSCFKLLGSRAALQRHLKEVHNKDQNIAATCDRCGKTFQNKSNLKIHMLTHSGVKPFRCIEIGCTAAFTTKQCLQFHYKKVHSYTGDNMPSIERCISYTFESYSGKGGAMSGASRGLAGGLVAGDQDDDDIEDGEEEDVDDDDDEMLMMDVASEFREEFGNHHHHQNHHQDTNSVPSVTSTTDLESLSSSMCSSSPMEFTSRGAGSVKPDPGQLGGCEDCCREEVDDIEAAMALDRGNLTMTAMTTDVMDVAHTGRLAEDASPGGPDPVIGSSDGYQPLDMTPLPPVSVLSPRSTPSTTMLIPLLAVAPSNAIMHHLVMASNEDTDEHSPLDVHNLPDDNNDGGGGGCHAEDLIVDDHKPSQVAVKTEAGPVGGVNVGDEQQQADFCHRPLHPREIMDESEDVDDDIEHVRLDHRGFAVGPSNHDMDSSDVDLDTDLDDDVVGGGCNSAPPPPPVCLELVHHRGEEENEERDDEHHHHHHQMSPHLEAASHHQQQQHHAAQQRAMLEYQEQQSPYQPDRASPYQQERASPYQDRSSPYQERLSPYQERSLHPIPTMSAASYAAHLMGRMTAKDAQGHLHKEFTSNDVMASLAIVRHYVSSLTHGGADYGTPHARHHVSCEDDPGIVGMEQDDPASIYHHHHHGDNLEQDQQQQQQQSMAEDLSSQFSRYELVDHRGGGGGGDSTDSPPIKVECEDLVEPSSVASVPPSDPVKSGSSHLDQQDDDPDDLLPAAAAPEDDDDVVGMSRGHHHQLQEQEMHLMSQFVRHVLPSRDLDRLPMHSLDLSLPRSTLHLLEHLRTSTGSHALDHVVLRSPPSPPDDQSPSAHLLPTFHHSGMEDTLPRPLAHRLDYHQQHRLDHLPRSPSSPSPQQQQQQQLDLEAHLSPRMDHMSPPPSHSLDTYVVDHHLSRLPPAPSHGMDQFLLGHQFLTRPSPRSTNHRLEVLARSFGYSHMDSAISAPPPPPPPPPPSSSSSGVAYHVAAPSSPSLYQTSDPRSTPVSALSLDLSTSRGSPQSSSHDVGRLSTSPDPLPPGSSSVYQECSPATSQMSLSPAPPPPTSVHSTYPTYLEYY